MGFLFFGNENSSQVKKLKKIADKVMALDGIYEVMSNEDLQSQTAKLKTRLANGETLNDILPDAYALVREASSRVLGMRHFYVQILGGIALHQGRISEMGTGEGKTLVATLPVYLNALSEKGVHVVTVNEYLAKRDAEWMGKVYKFLGLTVGVSVSGMDPNTKRAAYACDVTYCTNNELGFDYLRDNMVIKKENRMQRGYNFAIVDEVDSILIDEARTPLIISGRGMKSSETYYSAQKFVKTLKETSDFEIEAKIKAIHLTETGTTKAERYFKLENFADVNNIELNHHIMNALKANHIMFRDENYIVKDGEVVIVDESTGRLMPGRRYSDGLHQAIEAKEGVEIKDENKTLATVTFQNFFRLYNKLSGMTGTAKTEEAEFRGIYNLDVVTIPPNMPKIRIDEPDIIYTSVNGKMLAVVEEVKRHHATGRPVLVGTITVEQSEIFSKAFRESKIKHTVLNAKNHEQESEIVAQAGRLNSVTIATNMAGRGTDILLGGNPEFLAKKEMAKEEFSEEQISYATSFITIDDKDFERAKKRYNELYKKFKETTDKEKEEVKALGGLHIVGTERHESRRIDNQLRGRAGRQGDPGSSVFFLSLQDDLVKRFGGERMEKIAGLFRLDDNTPFQLKILSNSVETAQRRIEAQHYGSRKQLLRFDDVMNTQREIIYGERNKILDGVPVHEQIMDIFPEVITEIVYTYLDADKPYFEWELNGINNALEEGLFVKGSNVVDEKFVEDLEIEEVKEKILNMVLERYMEKSEELSSQEMKAIGIDLAGLERFVMLRVVDSHWMDHIDEMSILKNEIVIRGAAQQDPVLAYKREGYERYESMLARIRKTIALTLLNTKIVIEGPQPKGPVMPQRGPTYTPVEVVKTVKNDKKEIGRNEPCPCGSGRKYKHCCGRN